MPGHGHVGPLADRVAADLAYLAGSSADDLRLHDPWLAAVHESQREQFATLSLNTAVELTAAALKQLRVEGPADAQTMALRDAMRVLFPEAVAIVSAARQGFMRELPP